MSPWVRRRTEELFLGDDPGTVTEPIVRTCRPLPLRRRLHRVEGLGATSFGGLLRPKATTPDRRPSALALLAELPGHLLALFPDVP